MTQRQRENFYRTSSVIVEHGKEVLVLLLDDDLSTRNITLIDFIDQNQHEIYHLCYNEDPCCKCTGGTLSRNTPSQRVLLPSHLDILFDKTKPKIAGHNFKSRSKLCCSSAKQSLTTACLDLTLLRCLLINFAPTCTGAVRKDVKDLIKYRNNLHGPSKEGIISDADYSVYKKQIESVLLSIAKQCNKEEVIRQKLNEAAVRTMDDTMYIEYRNTLSDEIPCEKDTKKVFDNLKGDAEKLSEKLKHVERTANANYWRGRSILKSLLFSVYLIVCGLTYYYVDFRASLVMLCITFVLHRYLLAIMYKPFALLMSSVLVLFVISLYDPEILGKLNVAIHFCINIFFPIFSFVVTRYEGLPLLFLVYYLVLFKARFEIRNLSVSLKVTIFAFPFGCVILYYFWPHVSSTIYENFKAVIAVIVVIVGLKYFIW
ncbi:uncharacterized protein LOC127739013 [Mytilus californianus]|uniref:uncharacterized protein LOC127739013 n=1 Tax=Mytilus californianus TaxID=6549 RepID=UPI002245302A|nr:uncharacterized protein LOC127739013 [Mytilus californianus]